MKKRLCSLLFTVIPILVILAESGAGQKPVLEKIDHSKDQWYQLVCIEYRTPRAPYLMKWLWRNTSWQNVTGIVEPESISHGIFKMSDFQFVNPESRLGKDSQVAIAIFERNLFEEGHVREINGQVFKLSKNAVVWQPDTLFLLALYKSDYPLLSDNDSGYDWW